MNRFLMMHSSCTYRHKARDQTNVVSATAFTCFVMFYLNFKKNAVGTSLLTSLLQVTELQKQHRETEHWTSLSVPHFKLWPQVSLSAHTVSGCPVLPLGQDHSETGDPWTQVVQMWTQASCIHHHHCWNVSQLLFQTWLHQAAPSLETTLVMFLPAFSLQMAKLQVTNSLSTVQYIANLYLIPEGSWSLHM